MTSEKYILLKMKVTPFAGTMIMGVLVGRDKNYTKVKDCCIIHSFASQDNFGNVTVKPTFMVGPIESEGIWEISDYEIVSHRLVDTKEQTFKLYDDTMTRFRAEKAGLALPKA